MIFLFTEIDHPEVLVKRGNPDADHILSCQYFLIEDLLVNHGAHWTYRTPTGVLAAFEGGADSGPASVPPGAPNSATAAPERQAPGKTQGGPGEAALQLQKDFQSHLWGAFGKAKLKVVLHAGEAEPAGQSYVGPDVHHALKILEAAPGGQTLLTVPAIHFIPLPPGCRLKDLGQHFLKDLSAPQNLYALTHPDMGEGDMPPLKTLESYRQNFFPQVSPFFGREEEMREIIGCLTRTATRLVTLIGPGGFGKTRLALQAAAEVVDQFRDGVFMVALAPLLSDHLLVASIANATKLFFYGQEDPKTQLLTQLKEKQMLLVMDNFEHIIEGSEMVREMLSAAPGLKILATSREELKITGENIFEVKGLRYPPEDTGGQLEASSAVQLFLKSARRVKPDFILKTEDRGALLQICRFLEGMPLGLELAATWVGTLSLSDIAGKIDSSRDFLATSMPHLPPRHRSLRAVFEYSWILLTDAQKKVLKAVSVFRGGFTVEAVRKVAGAGEEALERLAQKSLVRKRDGRWEIHELLKYYAKEKLFDDPVEKEKSFDAHCVYYGWLLETKEKLLYGPAQKKTLEELIREIDNIREGWNRAVEKSKEKQLAAYASSLHSILDIKGWSVEGRESFRKAAESLMKNYAGVRMPVDKALLLARLLCHWADFENALGDTAKAHKLLQESLAEFRRASAMGQAGQAFTLLGKVSETRGDHQEAQKYYNDALGAFRKAGDKRGTAFAFNQLGHIASLSGNLNTAQTLIRRSLSFAQRDRDQRAVAHSNILLGDTFYGLGRLEEARRFYQKGLDAYLESGDRKGMGWAFINLGRAAEMLGDYAGARQMYTEGMNIARDMGDLRGLAWAQNLLGFTNWATGDYRDAQRLYEEGLFLYREVGDRRGEAWTLDLLGDIHLALREDNQSEGYYAQARAIVLKEGMSVQNKAWDVFHQGILLAFRGAHREAFQKFKEGLKWFESTHDGLGEVGCLLPLGEESLHLQDIAGAEKYFRRAASMALQLRLGPFLSDLLVDLAQLLKAQGDERQAIAFLLVALCQPTCRRLTKDRVAALALELKSHFSPQEVEGATQWAKSTPIQQVAAAWLSASSRLPKPSRRSRKAQSKRSKKKAGKNRKTKPKRRKKK